MNIKKCIQRIILEDQSNFSEEYLLCFELLLDMRSIIDDEILYNKAYNAFAVMYSKLTEEEQISIRNIYELDDIIFEEIEKSKDQQYDYELKNKLKKERINSAHRR